MKKYILTIICSLTSLFALAQSNVKVKSVHLIDGNVVNFDKATVGQRAGVDRLPLFSDRFCRLLWQ